ncbi:MAG: hypothetical protein CBE47_00920 [Pelagibacteraceae bacterium TMED287]|nr:MAG: hypothetical protein CBE47_00920 [Pelagibacteraceae bacterium TMED287]|tara:strand:- start:86 stop:793 length:708 start_codon:yes stop_codon:yes gene_type:complete
MSLPKLNVPTYQLVLPSTEKKIKFRPFLVKEQKLLLMAQNSNDKGEMIQAIAQIIENCTFGKVKGSEAYMFDLEYIFLQIRRKSVGDKIDLNVLCEDDGETRVPVQVDLKDVEVQVDDNHTNEIQLNKDVKIIMGYPTLETADRLKEDIEKDESLFTGIKHSIFQIIDGDTIYNRVDMEDKELDEFVESMSQKNLNDILEFFKTMPKLTHTIKFTNPKTKKKNKVTVEGIENFFI